MSTAEIKLDLISQIAGITDKVKLKELLQLLEFQNDETIYVTNEEEKKAIIEAQNQIAEGKILSDTEVQREIDEWLNK